MPLTSLASSRSFVIRWPFVSAAVLTGALVFSSGSLHAQGFVSSGGASYSPNSANSSSPSTNKSKEKTKDLVIAPPQKMTVGIHDALLTVDGMVAKVGLNYPVDAPFMYFYVPGVGTAIVSQSKFPNAVPQKDAFKGSVLTISMDGHEVQLNNHGQLLKDKHADAWVAFDPNTQLRVRMPEMGYGSTLAAPYAWPLAKSASTETTSYAPPVPANLRPKTETASSYTVTVGPTEPTQTK